MDAPAIPGAKPLVVISHGNGGSNLGHHELATYLASHGFIVATLEHPKDNFHDQSGVGPRAGDGWPADSGQSHHQHAARRSAMEAIDRCESHWRRRFFGNGGYTSLMVVGAVPQFRRFIDFCHRYPNDKDVCGDPNKLKAEAQSHGQTLEQMMDRRPKRSSPAGAIPPIRA
jgi:predicted dienelactone hydrolase